MRSQTHRPAVQFDGVTKRFGSTVAVDDIWLKVERGEFLTLLGPSGCGKTTLLNLIAGFITADAGEVFIQGECVTRTPTYLRSIGMVFQNYALFPHMTVGDNVAFGLKMRKVPRAEIGRRVVAALEAVRLGAMIDRRPKQLSGGQQQRVALARALVIDPQVLLLDEPLSALDKNLRTEMQVELKQIHRRLGITSIFVTHDQGEALSLSDRIAVMSNGVIQQLSSPADLYRRPANSFVASFVGDVNRISGRVAGNRAGEVELELQAGRRVALRHANGGFAPGDSVSMFLRPEWLRLDDSAAPIVASGQVQAHVYQGSHVDIYVACPEIGVLQARTSQFEAIERWPVGTRAELAADLSGAMLFKN